MHFRGRSVLYYCKYNPQSLACSAESTLSFIASAMLPLIFNLPPKNADWPVPGGTRRGVGKVDIKKKKKITNL